MTLSELLIVKAALRNIDYPSKARDILEREIRLKELERIVNTKEGNDAFNNLGGHSNTCDLIGFRQGYNAPDKCSCGYDKEGK